MTRWIIGSYIEVTSLHDVEAYQGLVLWNMAFHKTFFLILDKKITNNNLNFTLLITADNLFTQRQLSLLNIKFEIDYEDL